MKLKINEWKRRYFTKHLKKSGNITLHQPNMPVPSTGKQEASFPWALISTSWEKKLLQSIWLFFKISNLNFSSKRLHWMIMEEWCTIGIHRGPLTQITSFAGYIYLSCFSQWSLSHLGMSTVSPSNKNKNYLENGLGPLWFVQQCTLKSLRPNPAMPQPCILHILTFVFEVVGHWLYTIFLCCLNGEGRNMMIHTAISLMDFGGS